MEFFDAIACKTKIKALRTVLHSLVASADSAGQRDGFDSSMVLADSANAVQPGVLPASDFLSKLHALGLHIKPVEGRTVFFHTPAKSVLQERQQEAVLRKYGAYQPLDLCYEASKPWERFFVSNKEFAAYNRAGMRAEDPTAHKWSASKLCIDYTPFVHALDWTEALRERLMQDEANLQHLIIRRNKEKPTSSRKCTCGRFYGFCSCQS